MKHTLTIAYETLDHYNELVENEQKMVELAYQAADKAYAPYSHFHVGACVQLDDRTLVEGSNQENIAYPSGLCAERVALFYVGAAYPDRKVDTLVVVAKGDLIAPDECISPCGSCRQVIAQSEFRQETPIRLILVAQSGKTFIFDKAADLLIFPFGMNE